MPRARLPNRVAFFILDRRVDTINVNFRSKFDNWRGAKPIGNVITDLLTQNGLGQPQANSELHEAWRKIVGPIVQDSSRPGRVRNGVLEVFVGNSTVNQELNFRQHEIVAEIAKQLPKYKITGLKIRVG